MSCAMHLKAIAEMNRWRTVKDGYDTGKTILNGMHGMHRAWFNPDNRLTDTNHLPQISYASGRDRHEKGLYTAKYNVYVITIDELAQGLAGGRFTHPHMTDFELGRLLSGADFYLQENLSTGRPQAAVDGTQTALAAMYILGAAINPDKPGCFLDMLHGRSGEAMPQYPNGLLRKMYSLDGVGRRLNRSLSDIATRFPAEVQAVIQTLQRYQSPAPAGPSYSAAPGGAG